jgi:DNA-binding NarL/FixJ family response regulator
VSTVLAVDDDPDVLALLEVTLQRGGHHVEVASNGDQALEILRSRAVDVVLLDVMMPGRDGWSVLEEIKEDKVLSEVPVIMVTARGETQDRLRGGVGGALHYITKPFPPQQLLETVADVLSASVTEPERRRVVQRTSLSQLASLEAGRDQEGARPRMTALEHTPEPKPSPWEDAAASVDLLTSNQKELLAELGRGRSVARVAAERQVSRSNVYASIRRIHRKLGTQTVSDLVTLARETGLTD